jgi:hypothetical protein
MGEAGHDNKEFGQRLGLNECSHAGSTARLLNLVFSVIITFKVV